MDGCEAGNCLRSHVDFMETYNALVMITKAGVAAEKVVVGVPSYGRQFKMKDPNCTHKNCTYLGPESKGTPGRCTNVPEFISNAEIKEILQKDPNARSFNVDGSSKYMTYDGNWVSYLDDNDKIKRTETWKSLNFGGVVDWAIDLNSFEYDKRIRRQENPFSIDKDMGYGPSRDGKLGKPGKKSTESDTLLCSDSDDWSKVLCNTPGISQEKMKPADRWSDVKADDTWCAAIKHWKSERDAGTNSYSFTETVITWFLKGPYKFRCEILAPEGQTGCVNPSECRGPEKQAPASMLYIAQSLHTINQVSVFQ
jgi:hypothetical protein